MRRIDGIVDGVVADRSRYRAGDDPGQRAGARKAAKLQRLEQKCRGLVKGGNVGARQAVRQSHTRKHMLFQRVVRERREARTVLVVILNELRVDADLLPRQLRSLLGLVEFVQRRKYGEAAADRPVKQVGLRKPEHQVPLVLPDLRGKGQRFPKSQKVVRLVGQTDESARQAADTALQSDRLLALFLQLQQQVHRSLLLVALDFHGFVGIQLVEVIQLVDAQHAQLPRPLVEELPFVNQQFRRITLSRVVVLPLKSMRRT